MFEEIEYFYNQVDETKIYDEINNLLYYRLISTYIPNKLPSDGTDVALLINYFIKKVYNRTGKKLDRKNKFILDLVKISRNYHTHRKYDLKIDDIDRCCYCGIDFKNGLDKNFYNKLDILNPITYFSNRHKIHEKCIDHILPISKIGSNEQSNLQYICSVCNSAKKDICTVLDKLNLFSERVLIEDIENFKENQSMYINNHKEFNPDKTNFFPLSLFYRVISRYDGCSICSCKDKLLTIMPIDNETLYTIDNLVPVCYDCLSYKDTIRNIRYLEVKL